MNITQLVTLIEAVLTEDKKDFTINLSVYNAKNKINAKKFMMHYVDFAKIQLDEKLPKKDRVINNYTLNKKTIFQLGYCLLSCLTIINLNFLQKYITYACMFKNITISDINTLYDYCNKRYNNSRRFPNNGHEQLENFAHMISLTDVMRDVSLSRISKDEKTLLKYIEKGIRALQGKLYPTGKLIYVFFGGHHLIRNNPPVQSNYIQNLYNEGIVDYIDTFHKIMGYKYKYWSNKEKRLAAYIFNSHKMLLAFIDHIDKKGLVSRAISKGRSSVRFTTKSKDRSARRFTGLTAQKVKVITENIKSIEDLEQKVKGQFEKRPSCEDYESILSYAANGGTDLNMWIAFMYKDLWKNRNGTSKLSKVEKSAESRPYSLGGIYQYIIPTGHNETFQRLADL